MQTIRLPAPVLEIAWDHLGGMGHGAVYAGGQGRAGTPSGERRGGYTTHLSKKGPPAERESRRHLSAYHLVTLRRVCLGSVLNTWRGRWLLWPNSLLSSTAAPAHRRGTVGAGSHGKPHLSSARDLFVPEGTSTYRWRRTDTSSEAPLAVTRSGAPSPLTSTTAMATVRETHRAS